ncbi:HAD-IA family hydrolase [Croceicoccus hydrothermalis]|uniref:HAD-IA family hydrolase n=1 Tax=Croceicoccus hydrothermalis TaxID=2867964 RepID=UPI001EFA4EC5|nr:HAD-IA family hydrolase [Croceicoccus hydrothermalis]
MSVAMTNADTIRFSVVGFDLDGTLLDTVPDIAGALNHALDHAGIAPLPLSEVRGMVGGGAKKLLARALSDHLGVAANGRVDPAMLDPLYDRLLDHYRRNICVDTRMFDGLEPALDDLARRGIRLGVATNKLESLARDLLHRIGLADRFDAIVGGDTLGTDRAKPKPDMLHHMVELCGGGPAAFVGDSVYDTGAARAAGQPCVAVSFGYRDGPVAELNADAVIDHYDALVPTLARL